MMRFNNSYSCLHKRQVRDEDDEEDKQHIYKSARYDSAPELGRTNSENYKIIKIKTTTHETETKSNSLLHEAAHVTIPIQSLPLLAVAATTFTTMMTSTMTLQDSCDDSSSSCSEDDDVSNCSSDYGSHYTNDTHTSAAAASRTATTISATATLSTPKQPVHEISILDPSMQVHSGTGRMSPDAFLQKLFQAMLKFQPITRPTLELASLPYGTAQTPFIPPITDDELADYSVDIVTATREEDLPQLRSFFSQGRSLACGNRYGERLLHMACRRGFFPIVSFLTEEANCPIRITDDCGRTPLHDALWHRDCQYATVDLLLRKDPSLLLMCDKHGHTPFEYARREHWEHWKQFLWDRREHILRSLDMDVMELFRSKI